MRIGKGSHSEGWISATVVTTTAQSGSNSTVMGPRGGGQEALAIGHG